MPGALKPLGVHFHPLIAAVARGLAAPLDEHAVAGISDWFDLIAAWNAKVDLTAARSAEELADLMLADGLFLARHLAPKGSLVDVGSGAGGPGLAVYLARPDVAVTLVEPLQKRVAFLRTVLGKVRAEGAFPSLSLKVVRARGEDMAAEGQRFDTAVARATLPPREWLRLGAELIREGGAIWVLLAREEPPSLEGFRVTHDEAYMWPLTKASRRAIRYERAALGE
ncbi:MAG TPA: RsmG family class I SAM-dependent methyltransferase [Polyangiaceae bacterium]|nr:RsmG family class I SAM-dependent methyltransferase [Polyangiaceae bacterium]